MLRTVELPRRKALESLSFSLNVHCLLRVGLHDLSFAFIRVQCRVYDHYKPLLTPSAAS